MKITKIIKNSMIDYPGHLACVVFTNGCNWNCWYCQNKGIQDLTKDLTEEFFDFLSQRKGWLDGVVICGGEPTIHPELIDFCRRIKALGFDIKLDTNGTNPNLLEALISQQLIDYVAMDIKAPLKKLPSIIQCQNSIDSITKSISLLMQNKVKFEFRTTVTPDLNLYDIFKIVNSIKGANYFLQPYRKPDHLLSAPEPLSLEILQKMLNLCNQITPTTLR